MPMASFDVRFVGAADLTSPVGLIGTLLRSDLFDLTHLLGWTDPCGRFSRIKFYSCSSPPTAPLLSPTAVLGVGRGCGNLLVPSISSLNGLLSRPGMNHDLATLPFHPFKLSISCRNSWMFLASCSGTLPCCLSVR